MSESSIGANTRRIEAVSAMGAFRRSYEMERSLLGRSPSLLKTSTDDVVPSLERLVERQRDVEKEIAALRQAPARPPGRPDRTRSSTATWSSRASTATRASSCARWPRTCSAAAGARSCSPGASDGKVAIVVASDESLDAQAAVKRLSALVGGGGGGSPRLALAGGRDASALDQVLDAARAL